MDGRVGRPLEPGGRDGRPPLNPVITGLQTPVTRSIVGTLLQALHLLSDGILPKPGVGRVGRPLVPGGRVGRPLSDPEGRAGRNPNACLLTRFGMSSGRNGRPPSDSEGLAGRSPSELEGRTGRPPSELGGRVGRPLAEPEGRVGRTAKSISGRIGRAGRMAQRLHIPSGSSPKPGGHSAQIPSMPSPGGHLPIVMIYRRLLGYLH